MTVQEFYAQVGGGYEEMLGKFRSDDRIKRFLGMFQRDTAFANLQSALAANDCSAAFGAAHTLKGVSMNLCLHDLIEKAVAITEALRGGDLGLAQKIFPEVQAVYQTAIDAVNKLLQE